MKKPFFLLTIIFCLLKTTSNSQSTLFEKSGGTQSANYFETIQFYKELAKKHPTLLIKEFPVTDAGYPLHLVLFSADKKFNAAKWQAEGKVVVLINNGIHPGEPDGIDATMMLLRDLVTGKIEAPENVVLGIIPVYNIGGALNRNNSSRVNQQGPETYGFRGNAQNLDLNRDFTKNDSKNARAFAKIFHFLKPHIFLDNHVSDGADFQHTMTLLASQHNKIGSEMGNWSHNVLEPALFESMKQKNWPMCPYVNFEDANPDKGWVAFFDPPRYGSGYAALFGTIGLVSETHMLKPFSDRVKSTYDLMQSLIEVCSKNAKELINAKKETNESVMTQTGFPLTWKPDSTRFDTILFKGYEAATKASEVTGLPMLVYRHDKPYEKQVKFYSYFIPVKKVTAPKAYIIPQGWHTVTDILKLNNVEMQAVKNDTIIEVETYRIEDYKSYSKPYEKHHKNYDVAVSKKNTRVKFLKGDIVIYTMQPAKRYLVEMLEPTAEDGFFAWNFFDAILQQKEGYSDYRWEDIAAAWLNKNPELKIKLEEKKKTDPKFAESSGAQLNFIYKNSPYYEEAHMRYPAYRLVK